MFQRDRSGSQVKPASSRDANKERPVSEFLLVFAIFYLKLFINKIFMLAYDFFFINFFFF